MKKCFRKQKYMQLIIEQNVETAKSQLSLFIIFDSNQLLEQSEIMKNHFIDLASSPQLSENTSFQQQVPLPKRLYHTILNFKEYCFLPKHEQLKQKFLKFIMHENVKALFIFGGSGSGKTIMTKTWLNQYKIPFLEFEDQERKIREVDNEQTIEYVEGIRDKLIKELQTTSPVKHVHIYRDFPICSPQVSKEQNIKIFNFRGNFFNKLPSSFCKLIFILNSDIYNPYYLIGKERIGLNVLELKPYTQTQIKKIFQFFFSKYQIYQNLLPKDQISVIIKTSSGDIRKAFLDFYWRYVEKMSQTKNEKQFKGKLSKKSTKQKYEKFGIFHTLGKFLYAKRLDATTMESRVFTKQELKEIDPPFYFNPVEIVQKINISLFNFQDLLYENYLRRYGALQDIKQMAETFVLLDWCFPSYTSIKKLKEGSDKEQWFYAILLTWGIILKNKQASLLKKSFCSFTKAVQPQVKKQIGKKKQLIRKYYKSKLLKNVVSLAHIIRASETFQRKCIISLILKKKHLNSQEKIVQDLKNICFQEEDIMEQKSIFFSIDEGKIVEMMQRNLWSWESMKLAQRQFEKEMQQNSSDSDKSSSSDIDE